MEEVNDVLKASGYKELNPVQKMAVDKGFGGSMVVAAPTASGKTLIAEMAALKTVRSGRKVVYIVPLRALAQEKYREFKEKYEPLEVKVGISTGDLDSRDPWLGKCDIIIATSEKLDSLLRHGIAWAGEIGLVVADEIHLLNDPSRGPTLEMVLTRLRDYNPAILGLSATIRNYEELAEWLGAEGIKSDYRPVKLFRGICYDKEAVFVPERSYKLKTENSLEELTGTEKQSLVFVSTRRSTEAAAENLGKGVFSKLSDKNRAELQKISKKIASSLEHRTRQCERLARCIQSGTAFHHAGLTSKQRALVEEGFRNGSIKTICATPTLAAGLNLPAYRVIVRDLKRFSSFRGMDFLPALEVEQMGGRAGRPKYDTEGEAILIPKSKAEAEYAWDNYIHGETEKIYSKLGVEPVLRTHVLALIAGGVVSSKKDLVDFFGKTFYAYQYRDMAQIKMHLDRILGMLEGFNFIEIGGKKNESEFRPACLWEADSFLKATRIGKRVSELYIDPLTADFLIKSMERLRGPSTFTILHMVSSCLEMKPPLSLRKKDLEEVNSLVAEEEKFLAKRPPNEWDIEYEDFLREIKMASLLRVWAREKGEDFILENFGVAPGELRARLEIADWLLYSSQELGLLLNKMDLLKHVRKARLRVRYGVKEELLPLIKLKGVGRVRARRLFDSNIKSLAGLRKIPAESLARIVGRATAEKIREQLGE